MRNLNFTDRLLDELQHGLNTSHVRPAAGARALPGKGHSATLNSKRATSPTAPA